MTNKLSRNILFRAMRKAARLVFDTNSACWFERDLSDPIPDALPESAVKLSYSTEETVSWLQAHGEKWMKNARELAVARAEGHVYPNLKYRNTIIGYIKSGTGKVFIDDFKETMTFPPDCAFFYDIYVSDAFRNKGLAQYLAAQMMRYFKVRGYARVRLHIPGWNTPSITVARKLGFKEFARIRAFTILNCIRFKLHLKNHEKTF